MAETSDRTNALEAALDKATKALKNYKAKAPKATWAINQNDATAEESIDRLIRNSPVGSAQRQKYMDEKAAYKKKFEYWSTKLKEYEDAWYATRDAYQASAKLDPLEKKQQDNKDTGVIDPETDEKVDALKKKVDAAPTPGAKGEPARPELRYGPNGESLVPGTTAYENAEGSSRPFTKDGTTYIYPGTNPKNQNPNTPNYTGEETEKPDTKNKPGGTTGATGDGSKTPEADKVKTAWIGYLDETFKTLPKEYKAQIDKLFVTAKDEKWNEATFTEALKQTKWWKDTLPSLRSFFLETHDPRNAGTFAEKLGLNTANVAASLEKLGIRAQQVDPVTGKVVDNSKTIEGIAMDAIKNGWNDTQILQHIGDNAQLLFTGGGTIGSSVDNIKKQALNYGITIDNNYLDTIQRSLLDPTDGRDQQYYLNEMKAQAMDLYKPFASSLKEGRSLYEVTNSYRNQMATLLEVDSTNVTWKDLMSKVVDPTTGNARTFADFNKQVKQDPLWQYTKNAKETYSNTALDLMKQFGFMG
jgi:hypothetical protein